ncbi:hypothetical protein F8388_021621 [Cannabis sativa]|uniref:Fanconi-associated nuclease n=1 Tax=Cannabis sativa TaxID=3483 RepID=A0A7J6G6G2_CANSA|nr:hypothetical protein F8388_021621 [Cannabis sativa]
MLRGRESLIRLVGKRRRFLPTRQSILSTPIQSPLNLCTDKDGKFASIESSEASSTVDSSDTRNKMEDFEDMCLSSKSAKKRKLTQRTLLQMNFCSQSESGHIGNDLLLASCDENIGRNDNHVLDNFKGVEENDSVLSNSVLHLKSASQIQIDGVSKNPNYGNNTDDAMIDRHSISVKNEASNTNNCCDVQTTLDDISGVILETFIVGRKFSDEKEINDRAGILLQRDPHNVKDPNAIKVISAHSNDSKVFGFVPRELAQYLSPLIEKYCLSFEGHVTVVPKHTLDAVPIQIFCHKTLSNEMLEDDNVELFRYLWRNVQQVIGSTKHGRSGTAKYQQNFCVLVQEVLKNNLHLFLDDEKGFLESFNSFSDDSQRLFVRLYTRKGPWFRMSNVFYSEILDLAKAIKELSASGYFCSFEDSNELLYDDMNYILNLLNVSELREIMCLLKQENFCKHNSLDMICIVLSSLKCLWNTLARKQPVRNLHRPPQSSASISFIRSINATILISILTSNTRCTTTATFPKSPSSSPTTSPTDEALSSISFTTAELRTSTPSTSEATHSGWTSTQQHLEVFYESLDYWCGFGLFRDKIWWLNIVESKEEMSKIKKCGHQTEHKSALEPRKFISKAAEAKYRDSVRHKEFYIERGIIVGDDNFGSMPPWLIENIKKRKWEGLCEDPASAVCQVVKEFYANFLASEWPADIIVREVKVPFSDKLINEFFQLKNITCEFSKCNSKLTDKLMHDIVPELVKPGAEWDIDEHGMFRFRRSDLQHEIKCLHEVNVGKVVAKGIFDCAHRVKGKLFFPCLITELCRCAGVPMIPEDGTVTRKGVAGCGEELASSKCLAPYHNSNGNAAAYTFATAAGAFVVARLFAWPAAPSPDHSRWKQRQWMWWRASGHEQAQNSPLLFLGQGPLQASLAHPHIYTTL